ncbi:site-specific integrase, partial [Arthrospira platensis SPKY1]|nr:site-specific integrase [Arthrospira platensis SPKY1]
MEAYARDISGAFTWLKDTYEVEVPDAVEGTMLRSWVVHLLDQGIGAASIQRKCSSLRAFFRFLRQRDGLASDPLKTLVL